MGWHLKWRNSFFAITVLLSVAAIALDDTDKPLHFDRKEILIGSKKLKVEVADTPEKLARGLMFRKKIEDGEGMLFVFTESSYRTFWMKNTYVDLSIAFLNQFKNIVDIQDMFVPSMIEKNIPTYQSREPAMYAIEVPKGWFKKNNIKIGTSVTIK